MKDQKIVETVLKEAEAMKVEPDNLVMAITKLLEIIHAHGYDNEAVKALKECGITLDVEVK